MAGAGAIGPAISLAGKAAGGGGGGKGGGGGFDPGPGGVSPEQAALAQYTFGQNFLKGQEEFAKAGLGHSTMATERAGGARFGEAEQLAQMSNANQQAGAQIAALNFQQQQSLQNLANQNQENLGFSAGTGSFGGGPQVTG